MDAPCGVLPVPVLTERGRLPAVILTALTITLRRPAKENKFGILTD